MVLDRPEIPLHTAERTELPDGPDYSETLGVISHNLSAIGLVATAVLAVLCAIGGHFLASVMGVRIPTKWAGRTDRKWATAYDAKRATCTDPKRAI